MRMRAWEGVLAGRPYACALTTVSMTCLAITVGLVTLTLFDCVTCAIYSRSLYATSQRLQ